MDLVFIGDRPAQLCALVLDSPVNYTGDKLDPFAVYKCVERYVTDNYTDHHGNPASSPRAAAYRITQRHIVLSTGLTWAPKYDGMAAKQINTLLRESFITPIIYVLPVSSRILLGHAINAKLAALCVSSQSRINYTRFLGRYTPGRFEGDAAYPTQPTPTEVLALVQVIQALGQSKS